MKKFTVKDFLAYNNPCFGCGNQINFRIGFRDLENKLDIGYLRPTVTPEYTAIDLSITYTDALKLYIFHKTNKITTNNPKALTKYLNSHKLFLQTICDRCSTQVESLYLEFDLAKAVVAAVGLSHERIRITDNNNHYELDTSFQADKTILLVDKGKTMTANPTRLELPLLPRYRFRDRKHCLEKLKTYLLFS